MENNHAYVGSPFLHASSIHLNASIFVSPFDINGKG
jgi:hypothetical protein